MGCVGVGSVEVEPYVQIMVGGTFAPTSEMDVWVPRIDWAEEDGWVGGTYWAEVDGWDGGTNCWLDRFCPSSEIGPWFGGTNCWLDIFCPSSEVGPWFGGTNCSCWASSEVVVGSGDGRCQHPISSGQIMLF